MGLIDKEIEKVHGRLILYTVMAARLLYAQWWKNSEISHNGGIDSENVRICWDGKADLFGQRKQEQTF